MLEDIIITPVHHLIGQASNNLIKQEILKRLHDFFATLEKEAGPHATKVVRTRSRSALRDDDNIVDLPSSYLKRGLYQKMMYHMGWMVKADGAWKFLKIV